MKFTWRCVRLGAGLLIVSAASLATGCKRQIRDATPSKQDQVTDIANQNDRDEREGGKVEMIIRAPHNARFARLVDAVRNAQRSTDRHVAMHVRRAKHTKRAPDQPIEISLSSIRSRAILALIRLIEVLRNSGFSKLRVISTLGQDPIVCDVYSSYESSLELLAERTDHVLLYYADWSVNSVVAQQTTLVDSLFWVALSEQGIPIVLLDMSTPSHILSYRLQSKLRTQTIPTFAVRRYRDDSWHSDVFSGVIDGRALRKSIEAATDTTTMKKIRNSTKPRPEGF